MMRQIFKQLDDVIAGTITDRAQSRQILARADLELTERQVELAELQQATTLALKVFLHDVPASLYKAPAESQDGLEAP